MSEEKNIPPEEIPENNNSPVVPILQNKESDLNKEYIDEVSQPKTENSKPQTEEMEVQKHPHHVTHKKKWGEYLLEFLMLFLAVFLGFVAENIREGQVENRKEIEYIKSLTADLQDDVYNLDSMILFEKGGIQQLDSLIDLLDDPALAKQNGDALYYLGRQGPRSQPFPVNSRTLDQLKSSGGFLLIRNIDASNQIIKYYNQFIPIKLLESNFEHEFDDYKRVAAKIFDAKILRTQENEAGEIMRTNNNPLLLTYNGMSLKELAFTVVQMEGSRRSRIGMLLKQKKDAVNLKAYLQKEYHLENE